MNSDGTVYHFMDYKLIPEHTEDELVQRTDIWGRKKMSTRQKTVPLFFEITHIQCELLGGDLSYTRTAKTKSEFLDMVEAIHAGRMRYMRAQHNIRQFKAHSYIEAII
jgi:hypothetical protein